MQTKDTFLSSDKLLRWPKWNSRAEKSKKAKTPFKVWVFSAGGANEDWRVFFKKKRGADLIRSESAVTCLISGDGGTQLRTGSSFTLG